MSTELKSAVAAVLNDRYYYARQPDGTFRMEIYADYRDEMDSKTAAEICQSADPALAFLEKLEECYFEAELLYRDELEKEIRQALTTPDGPYPDGLSDAEEERLSDTVMELTYWAYPEDHFLKQEFCTVIMLDTGDGNYDFSLNSPYPCWYGEYDARLHEKSSLLWLARQQGYTKTQLWCALREGDMRGPKGFLESCRVECANLPSHMAAVTFLVRMTLADLIALNRCVRLQDRNGHFYDATKNPYCGHIVLSKETMCGLFDPWAGGGSVLEIQLEKDVRIPIRFIWSALPDGCGHGHYDVGSVYGMCASAWQDTLVKIAMPKNIDKLESVAV